MNTYAKLEVRFVTKHIDEQAGLIVITPCEGYMKIWYNPVALGDYQIQATCGGEHISGSPFIAHVTGVAIRDTKKVKANEYEIEVQANQLVLYNMEARQQMELFILSTNLNISFLIIERLCIQLYHSRYLLPLMTK